MLKHKWYRWIRCLFGARSFVKTDEFGQKTYVLIHADSSDKIANMVKVMHYEEEWPRRDGPTHHPQSKHGL